MICPNCKKFYDDSSTSCPFCGTKKPIRFCPKCGEIYYEKYNFCIMCGSKLSTKENNQDQEKIKQLKEQLNKFEEEHMKLESQIKQYKEENKNLKKLLDEIKENDIKTEPQLKPSQEKKQNLRSNIEIKKSIGNNEEKLTKNELIDYTNSLKISEKIKKEIILDIKLGQIFDKTDIAEEIQNIIVEDEIKPKKTPKKQTYQQKIEEKIKKTSKKPKPQKPKKTPKKQTYQQKIEEKIKKTRTPKKNNKKKGKEKSNKKKVNEKLDDSKLNDNKNNLKKIVNESKINGFFKYQLLKDIDSDKIKSENKLKTEIKRTEELFKKRHNKPKPKKQPKKPKSINNNNNPRFYGDATTRGFKYPQINSMRTKRKRTTNRKAKFNALPNYYNKKAKSKDKSNPGIYKIVNNRTGETFISNSIDIEKGKKRHLSGLRNGTHHNPDIQDDYNKGDSFSFVVLEEFSYYDRKEINQATKEWIKKENSYNSGYNRYSGGGYNPYEKNKRHSPGHRLNGKRSLRK